MKSTMCAFLILLVAVLNIVFLTGCKPDCDGPIKACPDNDSPVPSGNCEWKSLYCTGCPTVTQYKGTYHECVDKDDNPSDECDPPCYKQECTEYVFNAKPPCGDRTSITACDAKCGYSVAKIAVIRECGGQ